MKHDLVIQANDLAEDIAHLAEDHDMLNEWLIELEHRPVIGDELRRLRRLGEIPWDF
jgi:hypothetical protein